MNDVLQEIKSLQNTIDNNNAIVKKKREEIAKIKEEQKVLREVAESISSQYIRHMSTIKKISSCTELRFVHSLVKEGEKRVNSPKYRRIKQQIGEIEDELKRAIKKLERDIESLLSNNASINNIIKNKQKEIEKE